MNNVNYLEMLPLSSIAKYEKGQSGEGVPFSGYPRAHPSDKSKIILVNDPLGDEPTVLEFKLEDILFVEDIPSAVTEAGEGIPLVKLWVQRGAVGVILEPFEVNDPIHFADDSFKSKVKAAKERILSRQPQSNPVNANN
ncbi:MAG: hypothetical protein FWB73_01835 [Treponema sp.]|nr:hypothetical protein [Treponema sp.]